MYLLWHAPPYEGHTFEEFSSWQELVAALQKSMKEKCESEEEALRLFELWNSGKSPLIGDKESDHQWAVTGRLLTPNN